MHSIYFLSAHQKIVENTIRKFMCSLLLVPWAVATCWLKQGHLLTEALHSTEG